MPRLFFGSGFCGLIRAGKVQPGSIDIEDEDAIIIERDFSGLPLGFVAVVRVLPVEAGFIVIGGDPLFDGLPGWLDGLESLNIEGGIGWWRDVNKALPHPEETKEKLDFFRLNEGFDFPHGAFAAGALEGIGSPGGEDEVAPEGPHGLSVRWWWRDEERVRFRRWCLLLIFGGWFFRFGWWDDGLGGGAGHAPGFVGVEAVVADGVLAFGRDVLDDGGQKVGGGEDFEVPFGVPTAAGAVDDGLGGGVPLDFLEGEGGA